MKIKIVIKDTDNGMVQVITDPDIKVLAQMARDRNITPATAYAIGALAKIKRDSEMQLQESVKEKWESGDIPMFDSNRRMFT